MWLSVQMNEQLAREILSWKYESPYDFYNNSLGTESLQEFLNHTYFAIVDEEAKLIGFYCRGKAAQVPAGNAVGAYQEKKLDIGFGMKPNLTGRGKGYDFCSFVLKEIATHFPEMPQRLTVATFNKRAIHLYEKFGFSKETEFNTERAGFITMTREIG